jgi:hypothetical protein
MPWCQRRRLLCRLAPRRQTTAEAVAVLDAVPVAAGRRATTFPGPAFAVPISALTALREAIRMKPHNTAPEEVLTAAKIKLSKTFEAPGEFACIVLPTGVMNVLTAADAASGERT